MSKFYKFSLFILFCSFLLGKENVFAQETVPSPGEKLEAGEMTAGKHFAEKIRLQCPQSADISDIHLQLEFPEGYELLIKAKPYLRIFTADGQIDDKLDITSLTPSFKIAQEVPSDMLYAELNLYYCKHGDEGLCLIRNILFEIPLQKSNQPRQLKLAYSVPAVDI